MEHRYSKYITKEVEIIKTDYHKVSYANGSITWLNLHTKSGHIILTQYFKPEHMTMIGTHTLKFCKDHKFNNWCVDLGVRRIKENTYEGIMGTEATA